MKKIGFDIDETMVNYIDSYFKFLTEARSLPLTREGAIQYQLHSMLGISEQEQLGLMEEFHESEAMTKLPLFEGVREAVNLLARDHQVCLVTARPISLKEKTIDYFQRNFPGVKFKYFFSGEYNGEGALKPQICLAEGIEVLVEDRGETALDCASAGIRTLLIDRPWNRGVECNGNPKRVYVWGEIYQELK